MKYRIDRDNANNISGFTVGSDGVIAPNPVKVFVNSLTPSGYSNEDNGVFEIITETSNMPPVDLTFKVTVSAGLEAKVWYKPSASASNVQVILFDGDIFDIDIGNIYRTSGLSRNGSSESFDDKWTIRVTNNTNDMSSNVTLTTADLNKKNIILSLGS